LNPTADEDTVQIARVFADRAGRIEEIACSGCDRDSVA